MNKYLLVLICFYINAISHAATVYKYQDAKGFWVYSDQPPIADIATQQLRYSHKDKKKARQPRIFIRKKQGNTLLYAQNPFHAPIEIKLTSPSFKQETLLKLLPASAEVLLFESTNLIENITFSWVIGDPKAMINDVAVNLPVDFGLEYRISQGFNGQYSHHQEPSRYAVDIALPIGTPIVAAKEGVVIDTKDDYHMAGNSQYFLDKANFVSVLHDDGSYAVYAHLLENSVTVKPGDAIDVGQLIARSGSSGYSTGPHLHFVIRRNVGYKTSSVPFVFTDRNGKNFTPIKDLVIKPK